MTHETEKAGSLAVTAGSALSLWERLMIHRRQMAPHVASREAGRLIIAASDEIARLMMVEASAIRDGETIERYRQRVEDQETEIIRLRSLLQNGAGQTRPERSEGRCL